MATGRPEQRTTISSVAPETSVKVHYVGSTPQRSWRSASETNFGLGSVGRKCSSQLLRCLDASECTRFLEEVGLLEPVVGSLLEEAAKVGLHGVSMSEVNPSKIDRAESIFE